MTILPCVTQRMRYLIHMKTTTKTVVESSFLQAFAGTQPGPAKPASKPTPGGGIRIGGQMTPGPAPAGGFLAAFAPRTR
jgi:hypothetical protein